MRKKKNGISIITTFPPKWSAKKKKNNIAEGKSGRSKITRKWEEKLDNNKEL